MIKSKTDKQCYMSSVPSKQLQSTAGDRHVINIYEELERFWADPRGNRPVCMEICLPEVLNTNADDDKRREL